MIGEAAVFRFALMTKVAAAYTSQTCAACGVIDARSRRDQSHFICVACGHEANADTNAATNILRRADSALKPVGGTPQQAARRSRNHPEGCLMQNTGTPAIHGGEDVSKQRLIVDAIFAATLAIVGPNSATAQTFPSRPIMIVVPFAAGGPIDTLARVMAERMRAPLGQPVIVENVTGAAGSIGVGRVARAPPDGYTLVAGFWGTHVVNGATQALAYDVLNDFEPILQMSNNVQVIVGRKTVPANDLKSLITWLKANPDAATAGTAGGGSPQRW